MSNGELSSFIGSWLPQIEEEMRTILHAGDDVVAPHYGMMRYHLGWADEDFNDQTSAAGKRLRPILCLLACAEVGGDPTNALPAAAAIELLHNFSLIHDDVEDGDEMRRHRPTVWKVWGVPQAINAGDGMFTLAFAAMQRLRRRGVSAKITLNALERFTQTCLTLTEGQHMDLRFENEAVVSVDEYMRMIQGKTSALIGACAAIGALIGGADKHAQTDLLQFGQAVGMAFQIQDDILGIWGDPNVTGKAAGNDILRRKKSLPLLYALNHEQTGAEMQAAFAMPIGSDQLPNLMTLLEQAEARQYAGRQMSNQHALALTALNSALGERSGDSALRALAEGLLYRRS